MSPNLLPVSKTKRRRRKPPSRGELVHSARTQAKNNAGFTRGHNIPTPASLVPRGWLDDAPPRPQGAEHPTPEQCATVRCRLFDWIVDGLDRAQVKNDVRSGPGTYAACWDGSVVEVHRRAVDSADAVLSLAGDTATEWGYILFQPPRGAVGLDEDSDRRVLVCRCSHEDCGPNGSVSVLEMRWPVANAAMETQRPNLGFVTPSHAIAYKLALRGLTPRDGLAYGVAFEQAREQLDIGPDPRCHKPIDARRLLHDQLCEATGGPHDHYD